MNLKKLAAGIGTTAILATTLALATVTGASAHTIGAEGNCETGVTVDLNSYAASVPAKDAVPAVTKDVPHHDPLTPEIAAVPGKDAVPAVPTTYVQEWKFVQKNHSSNVQWKPFDWNPGYGWDRTGDHRDSTTVLKQGTPGTPAVPAVPAVPATFHDWTETVTVTPGQDAVEAKTNHVVVTIDGATVADEDFSTSYHSTIPFENKYVTHTWTVDVTAWDNSAYSFHREGITDACTIPVVNSNPQATITATCGAATIDFTNPEQPYEQNKTAAYTVWIDGQFKEAVVDAGGLTETRSYTFAEDSGDHTIVVKNADSEGGAVLAEATVSSDCIAPQPEALVTYGDWTDGVYACGDTTVLQTRTVTTTPYVLVEGNWALDIENADKSVEHQTRDLTAAEVKALNCPIVVIVTPPAPPVVVQHLAAAAPAAPATTVSEDVLAHTGSETAGTIALAGIALVMAIGGTWLLVANSRRRKVQS